jgi:hypothetical protein
MEMQTKEFGCNMSVWKEGDRFYTQGLELTSGIIKDVYGGCRSKECLAWEKRYRKWTIGFGRSIECDVLISDGIVVKAINVRKPK